MRGSQSQILAKFGKLFLEDMASCGTKRAFGEQSSFPFSAPLWVGGSARYVTGELLIQAGEKERARRGVISVFLIFHHGKHYIMYISGGPSKKGPISMNIILPTL